MPHGGRTGAGLLNAMQRMAVSASAGLWHLLHGTMGFGSTSKVLAN